jgi:hypothetical protein
VKKEVIIMSHPADLETRVRILQDIEAIKKLKARYWRCIDKKLWDELEEVYATDAVQEYGKDRVQGGGKAVVPWIRKGIEDVATAHGGHSPEIEITSATTARGIWALQDYLVWKSGMKLMGFGHYEDEYVKEGEEWKIKSTKVIRTFEEWAMAKQ